MTVKIVSNKAKCKRCNTVAESHHRHHLCFCTCGAIYVDGGKDYLRRGGRDLSMLEELSEFIQVDDSNQTQNSST